MMVDGLSTPVRLAGGTHVNMGQIATNQWQANIYTSTFLDQNGDGVRDANEAGLALVATNIRFRDGSFSNFNNTDLNGYAGFNEVFPLFSWYVVETDSTRYKNTGTHVVYDAGGPADGSTPADSPAIRAVRKLQPIAGNMANTDEASALARQPARTGRGLLRQCGLHRTSIALVNDSERRAAPVVPPAASIRRGSLAEGWQGFSGQNTFLEFGKKPFAPARTAASTGHVIYASTRPFDDPALLLQTQLGAGGSASHHQPLPGRDGAGRRPRPSRWSTPPRPAAGTIGRRASGPTACPT